MRICRRGCDVSHPHKRKRIILRLTPEQASDPQSILDATREALKEQLGKTLEVRKIPGEVPHKEPEPQPERMPLKHLAAEAELLVAQVLRQKSDEIAKTGEPARFDWKKWYGRVQGFGKFVQANKDYVVAIIDRVAKSTGLG